MDTTALNNRIRVLLIFTAAALCVIVGRLWMLQLTQWTKYAGMAAENRSKIVWEDAPRGLVLDRNRQPLIENRSRWDVEVLPADFPGKKDPAAEHEIRMLAQILAVSTPEVRAALAEAFKQQALESVPLQDIGEDVPFKIVAQTEARRLELKGIHIGSHVERYYPNNDLAAHLLGYARAINADQYAARKDLLYPVTDPTQSPPEMIPDAVYDATSLVGQNGVEKLFEDYTPPGGSTLPLLQGRRGYRLFEVNPSGEPTGPPMAERKPAPGATVLLTLDRDLQKVAEDALDQSLAKTGKVGAAVMVDVRTGEVLVLASRPAFDANKWVKRFTPEEYQALDRGSRHPLNNHAISDLYAPGSIFKLISSTAAFATTKLTVNDTYNCPGIIHVGAGNQPFRCWVPPPGHGPVSYFQAMAESCDVYFYNLVRSQGLTSDNLAKYARLFGLGSPTGIGLTGESGGLVPDPAWKKDKKQEAWYTGDSLNYVIGQGALTVTPLQMAMVTAAVANGGYLLRPRLVHSILWPDWLGYGAQVFDQPDSRKLDVDDRILATVRQGMREAVEMQHGTAGKMRGLGFSVAGKTGSAQHPPSTKTNAWFVCFAPVEQPRYACCVFIEDGGHGSVAAGPVARAIIARAFGVWAGAGGEAGPGD